jgi:imidazolonepropionase-like amidohydrolase
MQAIVAATSKPAQRLGLDDLGLLQPGYSADLVVLDENPLNDIRNTRSISSVFLNGKILDRAGLAAGFMQ